jgi:hypothetical protein
VFGYGLDDRAIEVRFPAEAREFYSSLCIQTSSGAHPRPVEWVPGGPFPGVKLGRGVKLTAYPHLVPRSWMSRSYTSSPPCASISVLWDSFTAVYYGPAVRPTNPIGWVSGSFSRGGGAFRLPLTPIYCRREEWVGGIFPLPLALIRIAGQLHFNLILSASSLLLLLFMLMGWDYMSLNCSHQLTYYFILFCLTTHSQ